MTADDDHDLLESRLAASDDVGAREALSGLEVDGLRSTARRLLGVNFALGALSGLVLALATADAVPGVRLLPELTPDSPWWAPAVGMIASAAATIVLGIVTGLLAERAVVRGAGRLWLFVCLSVIPWLARYAVIWILVEITRETPLVTVLGVLTLITVERALLYVNEASGARALRDGGEFGAAVLAGAVRYRTALGVRGSTSLSGLEASSLVRLSLLWSAAALALGVLAAIVPVVGLLAAGAAAAHEWREPDDMRQGDDRAIVLRLATSTSVLTLAAIIALAVL